MRKFNLTTLAIALLISAQAHADMRLTLLDADYALHVFPVAEGVIVGNRLTQSALLSVDANTHYRMIPVMTFIMPEGVADFRIRSNRADADFYISINGGAFTDTNRVKGGGLGEMLKTLNLLGIQAGDIVSIALDYTASLSSILRDNSVIEIEALDKDVRKLELKPADYQYQIKTVNPAPKEVDLSGLKSGHEIKQFNAKDYNSALPDNAIVKKYATPLTAINGYKSEEKQNDFSIYTFGLVVKTPGYVEFSINSNDAKEAAKKYEKLEAIIQVFNNGEFIDIAEKVKPVNNDFIKNPTRRTGFLAKYAGVYPIRIITEDSSEIGFNFLVRMPNENAPRRLTSGETVIRQ